MLGWERIRGHPEQRQGLPLRIKQDNYGQVERLQISVQKLDNAFCSGNDDWMEVTYVTMRVITCYGPQYIHSIWNTPPGPRCYDEAGDQGPPNHVKQCPMDEGVLWDLNGLLVCKDHNSLG
jgi:hypothetical protein